MEHIYDVIIIGGGPAGLSAGLYAGRAKMDTLIIEKGGFGGQTATTSEIANYPGIIDITGPKLIEDMHRQAENFGVNFLKGEVKKVSLDGEVKTIDINGRVVKGRAVIIATGANPRKLGFDGEAEFTGRGVAYCATCDGEFFTGLDVFVVGAGYAAVEEAMFLAKFVRKVTIIAREPEFTCAKTIADKIYDYENIEVKFNSEILEVSGDGILKKAKFINNTTKETWVHEANDEDGTFGVFVFVGYKPTTELFKGHIELDQWGYIITDERTMETSVKGVYAAGDLRPKNLRQVVTAVADGAIASTSSEKYVADRKRELGIKDEVISKKPETKETKEVFEKKQFVDGAMKDQLSQIFGRLEREITMVTIVDENNAKSLELEGFLEEVAAIGEKVSLKSLRKGKDLELEEKINADKYPVVAFLDENNEYTRVKFHGVPGGHEMNSFILAIYNIAGPGQELSEETLKRISSLEKKVNVKVAISLSCHLCPDVVVGAQRIAMLNKNIETEMVDIADFKKIRSKHNVMSVPALIINDEEVHFGAKDIEAIIQIIK